MPEESINIFINNIYSTAIFTGVFVIMLLFILAISRILIRKTNGGVKDTETGASRGTFNSFEINKDTGHSKTLFVTGAVFILAILFIFLILLTVYFANTFIIDSSLYLIFITVSLILAITVYIIKSGIISR